MPFPDTPEQSTILAAAADTSDNLLIKALAGAAKTSTLVRIAQVLPSTPILSLAFNKKIALEMQDRLPSNCEAKTLNSLGHRAWADTIGRRLTLDTSKTYRILKSLIEDLPDGDKRLAYENFNTLKKAIDDGKSCGYIPTGHYERAKPLMRDDEFFAWLDEEPEPFEEDLIRAATILSLKEAYSGTVDFNDQILMPTVFAATFPRFPLVMVDEAQDLSALNHAMLRKVARQRLIAVGDPCQAIYGFRGAHENSMDILQQQYNMKEFTLSISFRCPRTVVEAARWRAPNMQYPDWAKPGEVRHLDEWTVADIPEHAAIICRNNAPLFSTAMRLLKNGRYPEIIGNDIGKTLIKWLTKLGDAKMSQAATLAAIDAWAEAKKKKARNPDKVDDQADCLRIFAQAGSTLGAAIAYAEHILNSSGPVKLMTGHKSKGLEFDHVFFLDSDLIRAEGQDPNLRYVIQTRAKETLTYVYSNQFHNTEKENV